MVRSNVVSSRHNVPMFNRRKGDSHQVIPPAPKAPESGFPPAPDAATVARRRPRRSTEQLLESAQSPLQEAIYVSSRILTHSLKIKGYLAACSPEARQLVKAEFPELAEVIDSMQVPGAP